ncbi:MAG: NAD(P)-dependent oxidoreductase [Betaproteobacteria bacterium]|nr:NAD(P)-dependent oxidoreductase [Betaproteobacteria bacterium]
MANKKIGFIGVGLMGHGMAKNLVEKGFPMTVLGHKNRAPVEDLIKRGAKEAKDVAELVKVSEIVFLCVTGSPQVEDLIYRKGGILDIAASGQIVVDTSTSQPGSTLKIAADLKAKSVRFADAPLARTPVEAEQGRLNTMVGADDATFGEIEPVLKAFCENIFHVGEVGAGHKIKLINNCAAIGQMVLIAEALSACAKLGVDPKKYFALVSSGAANSGIFQMLAGKAVEGDFGGMKFGLANALKDVRYYNQMAMEFGVAGAMAAATLQTLTQAVNLGFGGPEHLVASLVPAVAKLNNTTFPPRS